MKGWIFESSVFAPRDLNKVLGALKVDYQILGDPRNYRVLVVPKKGHGKGVLEICRRVFGKPVGNPKNLLIFTRR